MCKKATVCPQEQEPPQNRPAPKPWSQSLEPEPTEKKPAPQPSLQLHFYYQLSRSILRKDTGRYWYGVEN